MSALTDRIAAEHHYIPRQRYKLCACGDVLGDYETMRAHVATVTEAAVRDEVAREIEPFIDGGCDCLNTCSCGVSDAYRHAVRIARGGAA